MNLDEHALRLSELKSQIAQAGALLRSLQHHLDFVYARTEALRGMLKHYQSDKPDHGLSRQVPSTMLPD